MTPFNLGLERHSSDLIMAGVPFERRDTDAEEKVGPVQYYWDTLCRLREVLIHVQPKLSTATRLYKSDFDRRVSLCSATISGAFPFVDRPPRALTEAKRLKTGRLDEDDADVSRKL